MTENREPQFNIDEPQPEPQRLTEVLSTETEAWKTIADRIKKVRAEFGREIPKEYLENKLTNPGLINVDISYSENMDEQEDIDILIKEHGYFVAGKDIIDVGCGKKGPKTIIKIAKDGDAKRYIGIDSNNLPLHLLTKTEQEEATEQGGEDMLIAVGTKDKIPLILIKGDMLFVLSKMEKTGNKFFVFAGLDAYGDATEYFKYLVVELNRLCSFEDAILLIGEDSSFVNELLLGGFKRKIRDRTFDLFVKN